MAWYLLVLVNGVVLAYSLYSSSRDLKGLVEDLVAQEVLEIQ